MGLPTKCMHFVGSPGRRGSVLPCQGMKKPSHTRGAYYAVRDSQCGRASDAVSRKTTHLSKRRYLDEEQGKRLSDGQERTWVYVTVQTIGT